MYKRQKLLLKKIFECHKKIVTLEENVERGGFGSSLLEFASDNNYDQEFLRINLGDEFIEHGTRNFLYDLRNISENDVIKEIKNKWPDLFKN